MPTATDANPPQNRAGEGIELRITRCGEDLLNSLSGVLNPIPDASKGPQRLATALGVDKVLASRVLKALRADDALCAIHRMPGPEPLRKLIRAIEGLGGGENGTSEAKSAIDRYDHLINVEIGDRSALDAVLSAWVPEARRDFEIRRKQAAYRAMSQLIGSTVETLAETAFITPAADGEHIDLIWVKRLVRLHRLRPRARVRLSSWRIVENPSERRPLNIEGKPIEGLNSSLVPEHSTPDLQPLIAVQRGEVIHYQLDDSAFGPDQAVDLCTVEVNRAEISRYVDPTRRRLAWFSSEVAIPARRQQFDLFIHPELFGGAAPRLKLYDTALTGLVDINDPMADSAELDLGETVQEIGRGIDRARTSDVPGYHTMLLDITNRLQITATDLIGYRCTIDFPLYGCQTTLTFPTVGRPTTE